MRDLAGPGSWEELRSGSTGELVLAVDIPPNGPSSTDVRALTPLLDTPHTLWRARERTGRPRHSGLDLAAYAAPWTDGVRAAGLRVRAVLGYGVGGMVAGVIAAGVARVQGAAPEVLLFDPELVDAERVLAELRWLGRGGAARASGHVREGAPPDARALARRLHGALVARTAPGRTPPARAPRREHTARPAPAPAVPALTVSAPPDGVTSASELAQAVLDVTARRLWAKTLTPAA